MTPDPTLLAVVPSSHPPLLLPLPYPNQPCPCARATVSVACGGVRVVIAQRHPSSRPAACGVCRRMQAYASFAPRGCRVLRFLLSSYRLREGQRFDGRRFAAIYSRLCDDQSTMESDAFPSVIRSSSHPFVLVLVSLLDTFTWPNYHFCVSSSLASPIERFSYTSACMSDASIYNGTPHCTSLVVHFAPDLSTAVRLPTSRG